MLQALEKSGKNLNYVNVNIFNSNSVKFKRLSTYVMLQGGRGLRKCDSLWQGEG